MSATFCLAADVQIVPNDPTVPTVFLNSLDADGTRWLLGDAEGWWTLPPPSVLDIPRPQKQDGSYDVEGNYLPRLVTITGRFLPSIASLVPQKRSLLLRACDSMRGAPLQLVFNEVPAKMAFARLIDQPRVVTEDAAGTTAFELAFKCVDPRKYSAVESGRSAEVYNPSGDGRRYNLIYPRNYTAVADTAPSDTYVDSYEDTYGSLGGPSGPEGTNFQIRAVNEGTVPTPPTILLHGPLISPEILNFTTSQSLSFPGLVLLEGETLTIDVQERTATLGNTAQRVSYLANDSVWWWLQPGVNLVRLLALDASGGLATGRMTFTWRSAWME